MKKFIMTNIWRISQTGQFLSVFFWCVALTGIIWPIIGDSPGPIWSFLTSIGVPEERATFVGLSIIFVAMIASIAAFGLFYDRVKLWREQSLVAAERNPYMKERLYPKEAVYILFTAELLRAHGSDKTVEAIENWVRLQTEDDATLKKDVDTLLRYIKGQAK